MRIVFGISYFTRLAHFFSSRDNKNRVMSKKANGNRRWGGETRRRAQSYIHTIVSHHLFEGLGSVFFCGRVFEESNYTNKTLMNQTNTRTRFNTDRTLVCTGTSKHWDIDRHAQVPTWRTVHCAHDFSSSLFLVHYASVCWANYVV